MAASDYRDGTARCRVVVVGAGVAGLAAANSLLASGQFAGHDVVVFEGSDRVGGRVETQPFSTELPMPVDLGAAWIHGTQSNPFADLADKFGIKWKEISTRNPSMHPGSCDRFQLYDSTSKLSEKEVKETWEWQDLLLDKLHALATAEDSWAAGKPLSVVIDRLVEEDEQLHPLVASAPNGRKRLALCVHKMETYMGATADDLQIDDFLEIDLIG
jgi:polyamine oxidase